MTESSRARALHPTWIAFGWFIAAAITSLVVIGLEVLGIVGENPADEALWVGIALFIGFLVSGYFVGARVARAPVIYGIAMGLFSVVAWFLLNILLGEPTGVTSWRSLPLGSTIFLLLLQCIAAVIGVWLGIRSLTRGPASPR
jgi:hypothetical protein